MFTAESDHMAIETPCINVCILDPASRLCRGCGRTLDEIGRWTLLTDAERRRVMAELPQRLARSAGAADGATGAARG
jgi:predicted Fe-S protein YdhL (DUF1289 family)